MTKFTESFHHVNAADTLLSANGITNTEHQELVKKLKGSSAIETTTAMKEVQNLTNLALAAPKGTPIHIAMKKFMNIEKNA